ncbi:MAG TPA: MerR family transcriptional regulator [Thermoanaerobaculia bacterium]|nr:MerR family transcriptional regulator [Thermoanaerobaculia bacterium]
MARRRREGYVMISIISERYSIHPQTLRLYEREGLITPARTGGNTRLYGPEEIKRLEMILRLTRDLGVNLAGVEVILNLHERLRREIQVDLDLDELMRFIRQQIFDRRCGVERENALVKAPTRQLQKVRTRK